MDSNGSDGSGSSGGSSGGGPVIPRRGKPSGTEEPQPQLQAWLLQQGVPDKPQKGADYYARRLAAVFGSQQAALDGLPATSEWCRSQGLTGLQTAALLDRVAKARHENVVQFDATAQPDWQLIDSYIAAHIQAAGGIKRLTHTSLAEKLATSDESALALAMPPGHVVAWLEAVGQRLPAPAIGRLLLTSPNAVIGSPATALAAMDWAADELGVADPAAFFAATPKLLGSDVATLQQKLDSLQQAAGLTAKDTRRLAIKQPPLLSSSTGTVIDAIGWLCQHFSVAEQLADVISRGPQLLTKAVHRLQGNADALQRALGWQGGDGQLAAFIAAYPQPFAIIDFGGKGIEQKLCFLTQVVGADPGDCIAKGSSYLKSGLETMCAHYLVTQERAPHLLYSPDGAVKLAWISGAIKPKYLQQFGMTRKELQAFVRDWSRSDEGRCLLEGLRAGSVEGWPRPPLPGEAEQRQRAEAEQRWQARAAQRTGKAAGVANKRQERRRGTAQADGDAADAAGAAAAGEAATP